MKKVRATLIVELSCCLENSDDEKTLRDWVEKNLSDWDYDVKRCELLDNETGFIIDQLERVNKAEVNLKIEKARLDEILKKMGV